MAFLRGGVSMLLLRLSVVSVLILIAAHITPAEESNREAVLSKKLAPYFQPPAEFAADFGAYRSPLKFADGTEVKTKGDWTKRRAEIRDLWSKRLGAWPKLLDKPEV